MFLHTCAISPVEHIFDYKKGKQTSLATSSYIRCPWSMDGKENTDDYNFLKE